MSVGFWVSTVLTIKIYPFTEEYNSDSGLQSKIRQPQYIDFFNLNFLLFKKQNQSSFGVVIDSRLVANMAREKQ
jgi:hypothetical protein